MTPTGEWTADGLLAASGSYWQACTLHAGVKLGFFDIIGQGELGLTEEEVAARAQCDSRATGMLLNALAAMGLLVKEADRFANSEAAGSLLVKRSPRYVGHMIMHHHHLVEAWSRLDGAVRTGTRTRPASERGDEERESFLMGMFTLASVIAPRVAREIDLGRKRRLLDLGGGPGTYAVHFCLAHPELSATVFDLESTRPFAEMIVKRFGVSERVRFVGGDYLTDPIEGTYDVVWLSQVIHSEGPAGCQTVIDKAASVLEEGGLFLVHDFILEDTLDRPLFPAIFSLNMLVNTESGRSYSDGHIRDMLERAGLSAVRRLPFQGPNESGIIMATR